MTTRFADHLLDGDHASRPAATTVPTGTLYACSDHNLIYQSDGATWATWATLGSSGGTSSGPALLSDQTLAAAAATISFGSLPATGYAHLLIELYRTRSNAAVSAANVLLALNSDTTDANYSTQYFGGTGATASAASATGSRAFCQIPGSTATANRPLQARGRVWDYLDTTFHKVVGIDTRESAAARIETRETIWANTAAVTGITLSLSSGSFIAGTRARLWGEP